MAKKRPVKPVPAKGVKASAPAVAAASPAIRWYHNKTYLALVIGVLVITAISFAPILSPKKEFINFDDPVYITKDPAITGLDGKHIKQMLTEVHGSFNYHPITSLSLAVNYAISGLNPFGYFITTLFIHLLNTLLVFIFLYRLAGNKFWAGLTGALLFGIHPMHVESVAWAAERKDVLYCFFFVASCIVYLTYIETRQVKHLVWCGVLFILSLLSKAMAAPLPFVLLLIDFYRQRPLNRQAIVEKIPFLIISVLMAYLTLRFQSKGAVSSFEQFTILQRIMFASFGIVTYIYKLILPVKLSAFYVYPTLHWGNIPLIYKIAPALATVAIVLPLVISFKRKAHFRLWVFGIGFFLVMLAMVIQFVTVGAAIMAERYTYVSYIGLFFIIGYYLQHFVEQARTRIVALTFLAMITPALAVACYNRAAKWQNDETIWSDVIDQFPYVTETNGNVITVIQDGATVAYDNRANYYRLHGDYEKAFADYDILTKFGVKNRGAFNNMGNLLSLKARDAAAKGDAAQAKELYTRAISMYSEAMALAPSDNEAIYNRAIAHAALGDHQKAIEDYTASYNLLPDPKVLAAIGNEKSVMGRYEEAIADFTTALNASPGDATFLFYRGTAYINAGKMNEGISDLSQAVQLNPAQGNAWYNLSFALNKVNRRSEALTAAMNAKNNGFAVSEEYINSLK